MSCAPWLKQSPGGFAPEDMVTLDAARATRPGAHDIAPPLVCVGEIEASKTQLLELLEKCYHEPSMVQVSSLIE